MAWLVELPASPRHPKPRWQVRYREGKRERSAEIYPTLKAANTIKKQVDQGAFSPDDPIPEEAANPGKSQTLFGDYVTETWWPTWRDQHPDSAYPMGKRIEKRILPAFANVTFAGMDTDMIAKWKAGMLAEGLAAATINNYLTLLGMILNAAVDSDYLPRSPLKRKSGAGRVAAVKNEVSPRREAWLTRDQFDRLTAAINPRYRGLVVVAALTGMRFGELVALRWEDLLLDQALNDGAVTALAGCGSSVRTATRAAVARAV